MKQREPFADGVGQLGLLSGGGYDSPWFGSRIDEDDSRVAQAKILFPAYP